MCKRIPGIVVLFLGGLVLLWCVAACEEGIQGRDAGSPDNPGESPAPLDSALPGCDTTTLPGNSDGGPRAGPVEGQSVAGPSSSPGFAFPHVDREKPTTWPTPVPCGKPAMPPVHSWR